MSRKLKTTDRTTDNPAERIEIAVHPKQRHFLESRKRVRAFTGGRGSGKSFCGALDLCLRSKPGGIYYVVAPSYTTLDGTLRTFVEIATKLGLWDHNAFWASKPPRAILKNQAEVLFRSGDDADSLRGGDKAGAWLDEMQGSDEDVLRVVEPCLRQWGKMGWLTGTFTPGPPDHWTSKTFIDPPNPEDVFFVRASLKDNPYAPPGLYESLCRSWSASPLRIKRELEGECVYLEGAEWKPEYFENIWFDEWPDSRLGGIRAISCDPSKGRGGKVGDYSAFILGVYVDGHLFVDADMRNDRDTSEIAHQAVQHWVDFHPHFMFIEDDIGGWQKGKVSRQSGLIANVLQIAEDRDILLCVTPAYSEGVEKAVRIRILTHLISEGRIHYKAGSPGAKLLVEQMMAFPAKSAHDDGPDALAQMVKMLIKATCGQLAPPVYGLGG